MTPSDYPAPWCSGLTRLPVKEEIGSSNLLGVATQSSLNPVTPAHPSPSLQRKGTRASAARPQGMPGMGIPPSRSVRGLGGCPHAIPRTLHVIPSPCHSVPSPCHSEAQRGISLPFAKRTLFPPPLRGGIKGGANAARSQSKLSPSLSQGKIKRVSTD